jgi:integrase
MKNVKLTATSVRALALPAGKGDYIVFDTDVPGFGLRLRAEGSRGFVFQYKIGSKQRRMALGAASAISIGDARKTAERLYAQAKLGLDPAGDKAEAKAAASETFAAIVPGFLAHQRSHLRRRSYRDAERHLLVHLRTLHGLQLAKITRRDVAACLATVAEKSGKPTYNRARSSLSGFFAWAMTRGLLEANVVVGTRPYKEVARERVLTAAELRTIWSVLGEDHFSIIVRLLMLTGQRANEIAGLRWSEVRLDDDLIVLPAERVKNKRSHSIPLSAIAHDIIANQPRRVTATGAPRDLIFGVGAGPFSGWAHCKDKLDATIARVTGAPLAPWRIHDIRRTVATRMGELGVQPHAIECCLNHSGGFRAGVGGVYNKAAYKREMRQALDRWATHLATITEGHAGAVVPLKRA